MKPIIYANICENDGPYYPVKLHVVPSTGDFIDLYSFADAVAGYNPAKYYKVMRIEHVLHDISDKIQQAKDGAHSVNVYVENTAKPPE